MVVSAFFVVFAIGCFLYPVLDPLDFVPNTFYTDNLSIYGLFQKPWFTHTCFGSKCLNLNRGLNKNHVFASKPCFTQFTQKPCCTQTQCFTQKPCHVLAGPVQALFAAYRIALSMVAGGTRRRRLNLL